MNFEERIRLLADGTRSVSRIASELNADFSEVSEIVQRLGLNCPSQQRIGHRFTDEKRPYSIFWFREDPGRGAGLYPENLAVTQALTGIHALIEWQLENPTHQAIAAAESSAHPDCLCALLQNIDTGNLQPGAELQTGITEQSEFEYILQIPEGQVPEKLSR
jgi:hypothetical protein